MILSSAIAASPIGTWRIVSGPSGIVALGLDDGFRAEVRRLDRRFPGARWIRGGAAATAAVAVRAYFDGDLGALDRLAVDPGGTPFQARVWRRLREVPAGATATYAGLARRAGRPAAARAAGAANARNPVSLVIPCHRVIGSGGSLTGYAHGLELKRWLLAHEGAAGFSRSGDGPGTRAPSRRR